MQSCARRTDPDGDSEVAVDIAEQRRYFATDRFEHGGAAHPAITVATVHDYLELALHLHVATLMRSGPSSLHVHALQATPVPAVELALADARIEALDRVLPTTRLAAERDLEPVVFRRIVAAPVNLDAGPGIQIEASRKCSTGRRRGADVDDVAAGTARSPSTRAPATGPGRTSRPSRATAILVGPSRCFALAADGAADQARDTPWSACLPATRADVTQGAEDAAVDRNVAILITGQASACPRRDFPL